MPSDTVPSRQMETRAGNKTAHPGNVIKPQKRRTAAEVKEKQMAKVQAKEDRELATKRSIERVAAFESGDKSWEDDFNSTPRPAFTPKPQPPPQSRTNSFPAETSDVEMNNLNGSDFDGAPFTPASATGSVTADESTVESDPPPPAKKAKAAAHPDETVSKKVKVASKEKAMESEGETVDSETEVKLPREPKQKKKFREEIGIATKELEQAQSKKFSRKRGLKRDGVTADVNDVNDLFNDSDEAKTEDPDQELTRSDQNVDKTDSDSNIKKRKLCHMIKAIPGNATQPVPRAPTRAKPAPPSRAPPASRAPPSRAPNHPSRAVSQSAAEPRKIGFSGSGLPLGPFPSLTSSAPSVLTNNVKIISRLPGPVKAKAEPIDVRVYSDAGLSDNDETKGNEREAAVNSPPKGKKRVSSDALVVRKPSKVGEPTSKKARSEEFPDWLDPKWFRHTFVTTYMAYVGRMKDPWDVPAKLAVEMMQKIWDETQDETSASGQDYKITTSTAVYQRTVQRLADSWRNIIGSTGIAILLAFFDSHDELRDSDVERQEFASYYLTGFRFTYQDSDDDNPKTWKGLFRGPFILQAFAAHLSAIDGSKDVLSLHDNAYKPTPMACGALGLSVASVERALRLVATGTLTIDLVHAAKGKTINLPRTMNLASGKESMRQTGFSDVAWGKATRNYAKSVCSLSTAKFDAIVQEAKNYMKPVRSRKTTRAAEVIDVDADERAMLVDNSGDESD